MSKKLAVIAQEMRAAVGAGGYRLIPLARGLQIGLHRREDRFRLVVRREGVFPSEQEVEIVRQAFGVPEECVAEVGSKTEQHPVTKRTIRWQVVELRWREL